MKRLVMMFLAIAMVALLGGPAETAQAQTGEGPARVRVIHASPDAPAVRVLVNDRVAFGPLSYGRVSRYTTLPADTYNVKVVSADQNQTVVIDADLDLMSGVDYTVMAVGDLANIEPLVLVDNNELPERGKAKVRFVHASPDAPAVDITLSDGTVLFSGVPFKGVGDYLTVDAGRYDLQVRPAGASDVVLELPGKFLPSGAVSSVFAIGLLNGEPELRALSGVDNRPRMGPPGFDRRPHPQPRYRPGFHPPFPPYGRCYCPPPYWSRPDYRPHYRPAPYPYQNQPQPSHRYSRYW